MVPNSGQHPLRGRVPKEHVPSLHAEELPPRSPPDQLCFACENVGLQMQRLLAGDPECSRLFVSRLPLRVGLAEFLRVSGDEVGQQVFHFSLCKISL